MSIESSQSRAGQNNATGDDRALFEKKMQTDVLRFFQATCIGKALVTNKTIPNGKSAEFPVVGNATAEYHSPGELLEGNTIKSTAREITIDAMLTAFAYIPDIDEAMSHYDQNSAYNESIGRALAKRYDQDLFRMVAIAAMITNATQAQAAGLRPFDDDIYTTPVSYAAAGDDLVGSKIRDAIAKAIAQWDEKDIVGDPTIVLKPASYYALLENPANTGLTWVNDEYAQSGKVPLVLGKRVMKTPHMPQADDSSNTDLMPKYRADFTKVSGLIFSKEAVGALQLLGLSMRSDYVPTRLSTLVVGKMAVGFGILNHSCAIALLKA